MLQGQGQRAANVVVLVGEQELRIFRIERDEALIARLITLEKVFWELVQSGIAPAGDGSDSAEQALRCLYPIDVGDQVFNNCQFVQEYPTLAQHYLSSRAGSRRICAYEPEAEA
ncbi:hypothetical protein [Comamonas testosteroni]|uniref:hypothetical protein n=1 Tax=Comamonas testosteroni TaxID=285 RepID=UPI000ACCF809|nr:hypothetical protein [Comamonas testosteroni]